jgi:hypothetical protein
VCIFLQYFNLISLSLSLSLSLYLCSALALLSLLSLYSLPAQYLQILTALLILVVSFGATAFVQPYETLTLNSLDVAGLFALIITQIASIIYFYAENATRPFMDKLTLEAIVTAFLFLLNGAVAIIFVAAYGVEYTDIRSTRKRKRSRVVMVARDPRQVAAALAEGTTKSEGANTTVRWWAHPAGFGVKRAPEAIHDSKGRRTDAWVWRDPFAGIAVTEAAPEMLLLVSPTAFSLAPGDSYRFMDIVSSRLSDPLIELHDKGGYRCVKKTTGVGCTCTDTAPDLDDDDERSGPVERDSNGVELARLSRDPSNFAIDLGLDFDGVLDSDSAWSSPPPGRDRPRSTRIKRILQHGRGLQARSEGEWDLAVWYYADRASVGLFIGPYNKKQLNEWLDCGNFRPDHIVRQGLDGEEIRIVIALEREAEPHYFYADVDDPRCVKYFLLARTVLV